MEEWREKEEVIVLNSSFWMGLYSMYRSLQYVIFTSCNVVLCHI